jgi:hypothetical protein
MGIGGQCGGDSYDLPPCHGGIGWIIPVAIVGSLVGLGLYAASPLPVGPRLMLLAWPALFISLGWAFLDSAINAPADNAGVVGSFTVCAVVFGLMGALPLAYLGFKDVAKTMFWGPYKPPRRPSAASRQEGEHWISPLLLPGQTVERRAAVPLKLNLVGELERLSALHTAGHLDDAEFAAAKARLLNGAH